MFSIINNVNSQNIDSSNYNTPEINISGNRINTDKFLSPIKVQTIDREEIENKNGESLASVLQLASGVFIKSYGGNASLNTISLNGLGSEHTLVLLNGFKLNSSQNAQVDLSSISKDNIEKIEVMNNGSSSLYGSEAIGGVINIVTRNIHTDKMKLFFNGQLGSYDQKKFQIRASKTFDQFSIDLNYSGESSENNYEYNYNNGIQYQLKERLNSQYDISNYTADLNYLISKDSKINLYSELSEIDRNIPGLETGSAPSLTNQKDNNWNNIAAYENNLSKNLFLKSQVNYQINLQNYTNNALINSYYKNVFLSNSSQLNYSKNNNKFISGYEISYSALNSNETESEISRIQSSLFAISEINLNDQIRIFPSIRADNISDIDKTVFTGKFGLNINPIKDKKFNIKASAGNNFASPTFNELYWEDLGNLNLIPETSFNFDAGFIYGFEMLSINSIEFTYTLVNADNKIIWSPNSAGIWTPGNIGKSQSNVFSIDLNIAKKISDKIETDLSLNYSYTNSVKKNSDYENDPTYNKQIFYIPNELMKCNFNFSYMNTGINVFYSFTGKRYTDFENIGYLNGVNLIEGNIYQNFNLSTVKAQIKLEVNNLMNENYQIISGYPMALRNFKLNLSLEY